MAMGYQKMLHINVRHGYYTGGRSSVLHLEADSRSQRICDNYRLRIFQKNNSIQLLAEEDLEASDFTDIDPLIFAIHPTADHFLTISDLDMQPGKNLICVELPDIGLNHEIGNADIANSFEILVRKTAELGTENCRPDEIILPDGNKETGSYFEELLLQANKKQLGSGVFVLKGGGAEGRYVMLQQHGWNYPVGTIIVYPGEVYKKWGKEHQPLQFNLKIPARKTYWCYRLILENTEESEDISLKTSDRSSDFNKYDSAEFGSDNKKSLLMCSLNRIKLQDRYPFSVELHRENGREEVTKLPYPKTQILSSFERSGKKEICSEVYYYL